MGIYILFKKIGTRIALITYMTRSQNAAFVRYEYIVYIHVLEAYNVSEILLTKDDFVDVKSVSDQVKWTPVVKI